jgi:glutamate-1-semialdehyde 2,1-aminomutase
LNEAARDLGVPVQATGRGSIMNLHLNDGDITHPSDLHVAGASEFKRLFHLHMLNRGIYVAARGMTTLNLNMHEAYIAAFEDEFSRFIELYGKDLAACVDGA